MKTLRHYLACMLPLLVALTFILPPDVSAKPVPDPAPRTSKSSRKKSSKSYSRTRKSSSKSSSRRSGKRRRSYGSGVGVAPTFTQTETPGQAATSVKPLTREQEEARKRRKITVEKPDLALIKQMTLDPKSEFYFPKLMAKYNRNDTTMTQEEYRNLYLGYTFQEDYDPYRTSPYSGVTDALREKKTHTKEEIDTIKKYAELTLRDNPFDLRQMSFLVHVLKERRKDMSAKIWEYRLEHLLGAIKSTGTGEDMENAFYVIYPMHEYDLIELLGYEATDVDFIEPGYDYLTVRAKEETARRLRDKVQPGFYFNVEQLTAEYENKHPESLSESASESVTESVTDSTEEDSEPETTISE
ncbi:MAG: DUF4919 domain-containing protein [Muribaculaceae bacterium]|nr:DUF4919 domain-containing protein [Muribaculaceae bacterium]